MALIEHTVSSFGMEKLGEVVAWEESYRGSRNEETWELLFLCLSHADEEDYDSGKPHLSHLCEKCKMLGHNCRRKWH